MQDIETHVSTVGNWLGCFFLAFGTCMIRYPLGVRRRFSSWRAVARKGFLHQPHRPAYSETCLMLVYLWKLEYVDSTSSIVSKIRLSSRVKCCILSRVDRPVVFFSLLKRSCAPPRSYPGLFFSTTRGAKESAQPSLSLRGHNHNNLSTTTLMEKILRLKA